MTYSTALSTSLDKVRFLLGDTSNSSATELLADAEITWLLTEESGVYQAAVAGAESIAAKFARLADTSVGDTSVSASQKYQQYKELAETLRMKALSKNGSASLFAGGISISDRDTRNEDEDRVAPFFTRTRPGEDATYPRDDEIGYR